MKGSRRCRRVMVQRPSLALARSLGNLLYLEKLILPNIVSLVKDPSRTGLISVGGQCLSKRFTASKRLFLDPVLSTLPRPARSIPHRATLRRLQPSSEDAPVDWHDVDATATPKPHLKKMQR